MGKWNLKSFYRKIPIHPSFLLLLFWFVLTNNFFSFLLFTVVVLTHEFGHYIVAKKCGYKLDYFYITPYGVSLNYKDKSFENRDEILIALAGPCTNFLLCVLVVTFWWILPEIYLFTSDFVYQSLMLGLFNLLPCYPLDGGRVFCGLLSTSMPRKNAVKIICGLNYFFSSVLMLLFIYSCFVNFNPTFLLSSVFLILGNIDSQNESKYQPLSLYKRKIKDFSRPNFVYTNGDNLISGMLKRIEINKYTLFVVKISNEEVRIVNEDELKRLAIKFSPAISLNDAIKLDKE